MCPVQTVTHVSGSSRKLHFDSAALTHLASLDLCLYRQGFAPILRQALSERRKPPDEKTQEITWPALNASTNGHIFGDMSESSGGFMLTWKNRADSFTSKHLDGDLGAPLRASCAASPHQKPHSRLAVCFPCCWRAPNTCCRLGARPNFTRPALLRSSILDRHDAVLDLPPVRRQHPDVQMSRVPQGDCTTSLRK